MQDSWEPVAPQRKRLDRRVWLAWGAVALVALAWPFTDLDRDGVSAGSELGDGTSVLRADSDGDGLTDGFEGDLGSHPLRRDSDADGLDDGWEHARDLDLLEEDSDGDGVPDKEETDHSSNPLDGDSDSDRVPDGEESTTADCDGDGFSSRIDPDDDNDDRIDGDEPEGQRCDPDVDDDSVLDGHELAVECITRADCDLDGLGDADERAFAFDPLDADTYDANLPDSTMQAFALSGQNASSDLDDDGIPDAWENGTGLLDWGGFQPSATKPDLLVEFVRVIDTGSRRVQSLSFHPAYDLVEDMFESGSDLEFQWVETTIDVLGMRRPGIIPNATDPYYADMLPQTRHATNPYVTTVFLNPQHDQSEVLHAGIAPIRGMIGAVDYGAHATLFFSTPSQTVAFTPLWESAIDGGRTDIIRASGFTSYGLEGGQMFLQRPEYTIRWVPYWFYGAPSVTFANGQTLQLQYEYAELDTPDLASTIAHELGHTLGLCHIELQECAARLTPQERANGVQSTMHSGMATGTLHFFDTEWDDVMDYVACPPQAPIALLAWNATQEEIIDAKYDIDLDNILSVDSRTCGEFILIDQDLEAQVSPQGVPHALEADPLPDFDRRTTWTIVYAVVWAACLAAAVWLVARRPRT